MFVLTTGPRGTEFKVGNSGKKLEKTMTAKYLGIKIRVRGKHLLDREKDVIASARRFAYSIFSLSRKGLDRSLVARTLWERCAIPSILYASSAMLFSQATVKGLEKIQTSVGNFILQTPMSTSRTSTWCDAGLMPIKYRIATSKIRFIWKQINKSSDYNMRECLKEKKGEQDPWLKDFLEIQKECNVFVTSMTLKKVN